jgi:succinylglutamic semialdehyde dehydrogenase
VGKAILATTAAEPGKLVVLELGGKNAAIVLDDADVERAAREIVFSAYVTAGQRCTATARVYAQRGDTDALVEKLRAAAERAIVGHPGGERTLLGPMIDGAARARCLGAQARGEGAGIEAVVRGREAEIPGYEGFYVAPALHRASSSDVSVPGYTDVEIFGPDVVVYPVDDVDEAIARTNASRYGLSAAVFTTSRETFDAIAERLEVGVVHHNLGTAGASGRLPFGGVRDSGNHRPLGVLAGAASTYLQAVRYAPPAGTLPRWPGLFDEP